jgi:hypothetical protein
MLRTLKALPLRGLALAAVIGIAWTAGQPSALAAELGATPHRAAAVARAPATDDESIPASAADPDELRDPWNVNLGLGLRGYFGTPATQLDPPLAVRLGLNRRFLIEVDSDSLTTTRAPGGTPKRGLGDMQVGVQGLIRREGERAPALAARYDFKIPLADPRSDQGTGRADHAVSVIASKTIAGTTVDAIGTLLVAGRAGSSGHAASGQWLLDASRPLPKKLSVQVGVGGTGRNDQVPASTSTYATLTYDLTERVSINGGANYSITPGPRRIEPVLGINVSLGRIRR